MKFEKLFWKFMFEKYDLIWEKGPFRKKEENRVTSDSSVKIITEFEKRKPLILPYSLLWRKSGRKNGF